MSEMSDFSHLAHLEACYLLIHTGGLTYQLL